jgi:membrane protein
VSFALMTVLFALIYKIMPRMHIRWHGVWIGSAGSLVIVLLCPPAAAA